MPRIAEKALATAVESIVDDCGGDFEKILIRPGNPGEVNVQWWPRGQREPESARVKYEESSS